MGDSNWQPQSHKVRYICRQKKICNYYAYVTHRESITNVNYKSTGTRRNRLPRVVCKHIEPSNLVLVKNGERCWVTVWSCSKCKTWLLAWRVEVASHYRTSIFKQLLIMQPIHSQTKCQKLQQLHSQPLHGFAVFLKYHSTQCTTN